MSINRIGFSSFLPTFHGSATSSPAGAEMFSETMRTVAAGKPSPEDIKTFAAYLQMRMNVSLLQSIGGGQYVSPLALFGNTTITNLIPKAPATGQATPADPIPDIVERAAAAYNIDSSLISAVIKAESGGNARATSPKGAAGLMQLMPATARDLGVTDPYDPEQNVLAGTKYLKMLLNRYDGNRDLALAAYNWGPGNLEKSHRSMPRETVEYVARIKKYLGVPA